jgi:pyridoxamine 5'-phosphate oxidase
MPDIAPPYYDDLDLSFLEARSIIDAGANNRRRAAHSPVVATIDGSGAPSQRVMILRDVDWHDRTLRFHTDARSTKLEEAKRTAISVLFYEPDAKAQIRLSGIGQVVVDGPLSDAAWESSTLFARRCYMAESAPGNVVEGPTSGLPASIEGQQPTTEDIAPVRGNFALLIVQFNSLEWLYLANQGHRRARWHWDHDAQAWQGSWLVP